MTILWFKSVRVSLHEEYGRVTMDQEASETQKVPRRKTALTYQVILDPGTILHLATGERFRDLDGHLRVEPNDSASPIDSLSTTVNKPRS